MAGPLQGAGGTQQYQQLSTLTKTPQQQDVERNSSEQSAKTDSSAPTEKTEATREVSTSRNVQVAQSGFDDLTTSSSATRGTTVDITV